MDVGVFKSRAETELEAQMDEFNLGIVARQRAMLTRIARFDELKAWEAEGCHSMAHWLSKHYDLSATNARLWVQAAHALERLPAISAALNKGTIGLDKVLQLCRFARASDEAELLSWARRVTVGAIRERADLARRIEIDDVRDAENRNRLSWRHSDDRLSLNFWGELPAADGAVFVKAIRRQAEKMPGPVADDEALNSIERYEKLCADALVALAKNRLSSDPDADRATVVMHVDHGSVDHNAQLDCGAIVHPDTASRLMCDARIEMVVERDGCCVGIGRASRAIPAYLFRQLRRRDHGCTFPGCGRRALLQGHHIWHWEDGGPTELDNLVLVCHYHHKLVHEGGWSVNLENHVPCWKDPRGSPVTAGI